MCITSVIFVCLSLIVENLFLQNQQCSTLAKFNHSPRQDGARTGMPIYKQNLEKCAKLKDSEECSVDDTVLSGDNGSVVDDNFHTQASTKSSGFYIFACFFLDFPFISVYYDHKYKYFFNATKP